MEKIHKQNEAIMNALAYIVKKIHDLDTRNVRQELIGSDTHKAYHGYNVPIGRDIVDQSIPECMLPPFPNEIYNSLCAHYI